MEVFEQLRAALLDVMEAANKTLVDGHCATIEKIWKLLPKPQKSAPVFHEWGLDVYRSVEKQVEDNAITPRRFYAVLSTIVRLVQSLKAMGTSKDILEKLFTLCRSIKSSNTVEENIETIKYIMGLMREDMTSYYMKSLLFMYHQRLDLSIKVFDYGSVDHEKVKPTLKGLFSEFCSNETVVTCKYLQIRLLEIALSNCTKIVGAAERLITEAVNEKNNREFIAEYISAGEGGSGLSYKNFLGSFKIVNLNVDSVYELCVSLNKQLKIQTSLQEDATSLSGATSKVKEVYEVYAGMKMKETFKTLDAFEVYRSNHIADTVAKTTALNCKLIKILALAIVYSVAKDADVSFSFKSDVEKFSDMVQTLELFIENMQYVKLHETIDLAQPHITAFVEQLAREVEDGASGAIEKDGRDNENDFEI